MKERRRKYQRPRTDGKSIQEKLQAAGLSQEDCEFYCRQFASCRRPYIKRKDDSWRYCKYHSLQDDQIADHLAEINTYGTTSGPETDYIVIDIDLHDNSINSKKDFHKRLERIYELFPASVLIRSSSSGGIHLYQFFEDHHPLQDVLQFTENRLRHASLYLAPGRIELFPRENRGLRLPLGKDSYLLDPETLTRASASKAEDVFYLRNTCDRLLLEEVYDEEDYAYVPNRIAANTENPIRAIVRISNSTQFDKKCQHYLEHGLEHFSTRYRITSMLICYALFHLHHSEEQTYKFVEDWLIRKHNSYSKDWNRNPNSVLRILRAQVRSYAKYGTKPFSGLSRREANLIFQHNLSFDEDTFLFDLLRFLKSKANQKKLVHISRSLFCRFQGASNRTYIKRRELAYSLGFLEKKHGHYQGDQPGEGIAALYRHHLTFDYDNEEFFYIDQAITILFDSEEIRRRYTTYRNRILLKQQKEALICSA